MTTDTIVRELDANVDNIEMYQFLALVGKRVIHPGGSHGLSDVRYVTGIPSVMSPWGVLRDEGIVNTLNIARRVLSKRSYLKKAQYLMGRLGKLMPYIGWTVVSGTK